MIDNNDKQSLENFLFDIDVLDKISSKLCNFNVFETLGLVNTEIRHSNVLGWFLNPNENHGLDDMFVKKFIQSICYDNKKYLEQSSMNLFFISLMNYSDIIIRREWQNIDILVISEINKFVMVIENKIRSKESSHQLGKYFDIIENEFKSYKKIYIFLTPNGDLPSDEANWHWLQIDYCYVLNSLEKTVELKKDSLSQNVKFFIEQYILILRRYIVGNDELEVICREIYFKHQKALDLIFNYKPDVYYDISKYLEILISENSNLILDSSSKSYVRFINKSIDNLLKKDGEGWTTSKRILLYEFQNRNDKLVLKLIIGPGTEDIRNKLYNIATNNKDLFKGIYGSLSSKWTQIYAKEILLKNFLEKYDSDINKIQEEIQKKLIKLFETDINEIESIICMNLNENNFI